MGNTNNIMANMGYSSTMPRGHISFITDSGANVEKIAKRVSEFIKAYPDIEGSVYNRFKVNEVKWYKEYSDMEDLLETFKNLHNTNAETEWSLVLASKYIIKFVPEGDNVSIGKRFFDMTDFPYVVKYKDIRGDPKLENILLDMYTQHLAYIGVYDHNDKNATITYFHSDFCPVSTFKQFGNDIEFYTVESDDLKNLIKLNEAMKLEKLELEKKKLELEKKKKQEQVMSIINKYNSENVTSGPTTEASAPPQNNPEDPFEEVEGPVNENLLP